MSEDTPTERATNWVKRFAFVPPSASVQGVCAPEGKGLPQFSVMPAAGGRQLVRVSLPFPAGAFPSELSLVVKGDDEEIIPDVRHLTYHPGKPTCVRRAMITFPFVFDDTSESRFTLALAPAVRREVDGSQAEGVFSGKVGDVDFNLTRTSVEIGLRSEQAWQAKLIAPDLEWDVTPTVEIIEQGQHYLWVRLLVPDARWPRIIEVRADSIGTVAVRAHLQRLKEGDGRAPDLGWSITGPEMAVLRSNEKETRIGAKPVEHGFAFGDPAHIRSDSMRVSFPDAHLLRRGVLTTQNADETSTITYLRCQASEGIPHQEAAWRTATFVLSRAETAPWNALLELPHRIRVSPQAFDTIYQSGISPDLSVWDDLAAVRRFHMEGTVQSVLEGDDFGNITGYPAGVFGMNRLNHCPSIFHEYYRSGDMRLREAALYWCNNFYDLSIWWGTSIDGHFGGTRYNNVSRHHDLHKDDKSFMWRSNNAVNFCTKGYDSFFYAYEETGDPRMATALRWQVDYASREVHTNTGECRNIGDVADFVRLYRFTGQQEYLDEALRLFRELRTKLSEGDLFSQSGRPIEDDPPFIDDDGTGYQNPFAKPYIIGYALAGLPVLAEYSPDETKLRDVVRAVADFLAESEDPVGGWRYPHPQSTRVLVAQGMEHAAQLVRAAGSLQERGEPIGDLLDAIEKVLQSRILFWQKTGGVFSGLGGWETALGVIGEGTSIYDLYQTPQERDPVRDYSEGSVSSGGSAPEGIVYFSEVLDFYLHHRPAERLFHANPELKTVLDRMPETKVDESRPAGKQYLRYGTENKLPTFNTAQAARLTFPMAYDPESGADFTEWRERARAKLLECLLRPPPRAPFEPAVLAVEDRGSYEARKIVFNVSADCRIPTYLLVPEGQGPFPGLITLHDHGAHFSIGKEKVVRPFDEPEERIADAETWAEKNYAGRFIGDELARRGYVVFAMDALFWGDRGRREGVDYNAQQELAANLFQLGMSWSGVITWDDIRSAEFVASLPEVDPDRIGAIGLSMGSHRTWMLCAASDRVVAGVAVCWMGTTDSLMSPGNNQTKGYSAYSMLHPDLRNYLDYADVAAIACPRPMMFFNGEQDGLFPIDGVKDAYARMRRVWEGRGVGDRLLTKIWPVGHVFSEEMQQEAFDWLDGQLGDRK